MVGDLGFVVEFGLKFLGFASDRFGSGGNSCLRSMAAARHGGYRSHDASRRRELDLERSRRSKEYRRPSRDRDSERRRDRGSRGCEVSNGYSRHRSPYPPPRSRPSSRRKDDKEPGEVSSDSGSESVGRRPVLREDGVLGVCRDGGALPPSKKRKHSPGLHDRNVSKLQAREDEAWSRRGPDALAAELPLPSPHPLSDSDSTVVQSAGGCLPMNSEVLVVPGDAERRDGITEEEEECATRNIFTSRWADADEEDEEVTVPKKKKSVSPAHLPEQKSTKEVVSPELGEVMVSKTSRRASSSSSNSMGSENCNIELDGGDSMDVEKEGDIDSSAGCSPDTRYRRSGTPEAVRPPRRCFNMLQGCRSIDEFERINTINEGTYGVVFRVRDKKTGEIVALKKVKVDKEKGREGFPLTSLREINILLSFDHPSIVDVKEVVVGGHDDDTFMVMEYMEHDLKGVMEAMKQPYTQSEVKCLMLQLLEGVKYLHDNWVLHR